MEQIGSNPFLKQDIVSQVEPASAVESWSKVKEILLETPDKAKAISELIEFARQQSNTDLKIGALVKAEISASALSMPGEDLTRLNCLYDIFLELSKIHGQRENALEKAKIKLRTTFGQPGQEHQAFITFQNELGNSSECAENTNKQIFTPEEEKALSAYNQFNLLVRKLDPFDQLCCASLFFPKTDQEKEQIEKWIEVNILDCMASRAKILRKSEKLPAFLILNLLLKGQEQILEHRSFEDPRFIKKIDNLLNQKRKAHANLIALSPVWNQKLADSIFVDLYVNPDKFESPIKSDEHEGKSSVMIVLRKDGDFFSIGERLQNCWEPEPTKGHKKSKLLVGNFWVLTHYFVDKDTTAIASIDKESDRLAMIFIVKKALVNGQQAFVIEDFDFTFQPSVKKTEMMELATGNFIVKHENIIFIGQPGTGKTHLSIALGLKALGYGYTVLFTSVADMITTLEQSRADLSYQKKIQQYVKPDLLILDELGYKSMAESTVEDFFEIVSRRYEKGSIIITSNRDFQEWGKIFIDKTLTGAILDRLVHHCHIVTIKGESYRVSHRNQKA